MIYCMFKLETSGMRFEGVASTSDRAKAAIKDGQYLVCPIEIDQRYETDIASEGFPGAVLVKPVIVDQQDQILTALQTMSTRLTNLDTFTRQTVVPQVQAELETIKTRLDALENVS